VENYLKLVISHIGHTLLLYRGCDIPFGTQLVYQTINTSPTRRIKTRHITASVITLLRPDTFNSQDFNI